MTNNLKLARSIGLTLVGVSFVLPFAGAVIPIFGPMVASIAPDMFLAGLATLFFSYIRRHTKHVAVTAAATILFTVVVGLNTRIPSIISDAGDKNDLQVSRVLVAAPGQPLHVQTNTPELSGRVIPSASVIPACRGNGCFITSGFHGPFTAIPRDYWRENVAELVLLVGFTPASTGEKAPRLLASELRDVNLATVTLALIDESDVQVARFRGTFRHGYPFESRDEGEDNLGSVGLVPGLLQYLLHANSISLTLSRYARPGVSPPLGEFLKAAFSFTDQQAQGAGDATPVAPDVLSEAYYEPLRVINIDPYAKIKETDPFFDPTLEERCLRLVRPERLAGPGYGWLLFNGDPTGRKKVRNDRFLRCDPDALWLFHIVPPPFNPPPPHIKYVLMKYTAAGDPVYRISFDELAPIYGFEGGMIIPTFNAQAGYLTFDWWNTHQGQGYEMLVKRAMKVRIAEPKPQAFR